MENLSVQRISDFKGIKEWHISDLCSDEKLNPQFFRYLLFSVFSLDALESEWKSTCIMYILCRIWGYGINKMLNFFRYFYRCPRDWKATRRFWSVYFVYFFNIFNSSLSTYYVCRGSLICVNISPKIYKNGLYRKQNQTLKLLCHHSNDLFGISFLLP